MNGKWHNIYDAFIKSLKKKSSQSVSKKYLYYNDLTFLLKVVQSDHMYSSINVIDHDKNSLLNEDHDEGESENNFEVKTQENISIVYNDKRNYLKKARLQNAKKTMPNKL